MNGLLKVLALILKILTYPFFRIPCTLFTLKVKSVGILIFDCTIVAVICTVMGLLNFYEGIVIVGLYFVVALALGFAWRGLIRLYCTKFQSKVTKVKEEISQGYATKVNAKNTAPTQQTIEKPVVKSTKQPKTFEALPDFDAMDGAELGRWILEHPDKVNIKNNKVGD